MKNRSEWDLMNSETFSQVFDMTHLQIFHYLYGFTGSSLNDVEDLLAETFIRAWQYRGQFHGDENTVLFWLLRIARNQVFDAYRRKKARGNPTSLEVEDAETITDFSPGPENAYLEVEKRKAVWQLLQNLSDEVREIFILRYFLDWPIKQIASFTGKGETAISMTIHRALKRLQEDVTRIDWIQERR
jgi:RNA polymerase sigma-70 factor (ECF subfamily)